MGGARRLRSASNVERRGVEHRGVERRISGQGSHHRGPRTAGQLPAQTDSRERTADSGQAETQTTVPQSVTRVTGPGDGGGVTEEREDRDWNAQLSRLRSAQASQLCNWLRVDPASIPPSLRIAAPSLSLSSVLPLLSRPQPSLPYSRASSRS